MTYIANVANTDIISRLIKASSDYQFTSATTIFINVTQSSLFQHTTGTSFITSAAFPSINTTKFAGTGTSGTNVTMTLNSIGFQLSVDPGGDAGNIDGGHASAIYGGIPIIDGGGAS